MISRNRMNWIALPMMLTATIGLLAFAAPVMPSRRSVPDPVLSVAGLSELYVEVVEVPAPLRDLGVSQDGLQVQCRKALRNAGFDVDPDGAAPSLMMKLYWMSATELPDAAGYVVSMRLSQPVRVDRVDRLLNVPTLALVAGNIETKANLEASLERAVDQLVRNFIDATRTGAEAMGPR